MPVFNEAATVGEVIAMVLAQSCVAELICVNDCSSDGSGRVLDALAAADPRIRAFHHPVNLGKGAALRTGISHATAPIVIIQDADLEYDPTEYPEITAKVARLGVRIYEVAISYHGRTYAEGKKIGWKDGFSAIRCILKYNLLAKSKA